MDSFCTCAQKLNKDSTKAKSECCECQTEQEQAYWKEQVRQVGSWRESERTVDKRERENTKEKKEKAVFHSHLLEGKAKNGDLFVCNSVEECPNDAVSKPPSLKVVHVNNLFMEQNNKKRILKDVRVKIPRLLLVIQLAA